MEFKYMASKRATDYKVTGVITRIITIEVELADKIHDVPTGFVLTTLDRMPKKLYFNIRQDSIDDLLLIELKLVTVNFWIECIEYNEKLFNNLYTNDLELYSE
jgi:hypothetical protein